MPLKKPRLCCLIGDPVEHSLSPLMFNSVFATEGMDCAYMAFRVGRADLSRALEGLRALGFVGCNVTIPHKVEVIKYLDRLDESAQGPGSVNAILNRGGELIGYSTDGYGVLKALEREGIRLEGTRILLLGYGGGARAVAFELARSLKRAEIMITGRDMAKASALAGELSALARTEALPLGNVGSSGAGVIINCTPVGMWPNADESPLAAESISMGTAVMDLVYNPAETKLLKIAKARGCRTVGGLEMLVQQGARAFEIWFGRTAPVSMMRKAVEGRPL
jgi:shikimate dehydrogenase